MDRPPSNGDETTTAQRAGVVRIAGQWFVRTGDESVGPLATSAEVERYLALLDAVAAARGEVRRLTG